MQSRSEETCVLRMNDDNFITSTCEVPSVAQTQIQDMAVQYSIGSQETGLFSSTTCNNTNQSFNEQKTKHTVAYSLNTNRINIRPIIHHTVVCSIQ